MSYHISRMVTGDFAAVLEKTRAALKKEGFGVLTEIDVRATLKEKLGVDFRPYRILGACNPPFAHKALTIEDHIGVMLPCNVVVQVRQGGKVEVSAVDPIASMSAVENRDLGGLADEMRARLSRVVKSIA